LKHARGSVDLIRAVYFFLLLQRSTASQCLEIVTPSAILSVTNTAAVSSGISRLDHPALLANLAPLLVSPATA